MTLPLSQILSLLRDQGWNSVGIVVGIVLYLVDKMRQSRKEIAYKVDFVENSSSCSSSERTIRLKIWNRGNETILPEDYGNPIEFTFGSQASISKPVQVVETKPSGFKVKPEVDKDKVTIHPPKLWKRHESVVLEFVVKGFEALNANVRINGKTINLSEKSHRLLETATDWRKYIFAALFLWAIFFVVHLKSPSIQMFYYASLVFGVLTCILATRSIINNITALRYG